MIMLHRVVVAETTKNPIGTRLSHHNLTISWNFVGHLEKFYSNVRQKLGRPPGDDMPEIDVNTMIWRIFMSSTKKETVHLGQDHQENVEATKNTDFEKIKHMIGYFTEIDPGSRARKYMGYLQLMGITIPWMRTALLKRQSRQAVDSKGIRFL